MKLSIIILNYNVMQWLRNCLLSIEKHVHDIDYEVIVIDNQNPDSSWKDFNNGVSSVKFIENFPMEGLGQSQ